MNILLVNLALSFIVALIGTLLAAGLARWIGGYFADPANARVAAFGAAIGYVLGKYSYVRPLGSEFVWTPIASFMGAIVALVIVWFVLFKRREPLNDSES